MRACKRVTGLSTHPGLVPGRTRPQVDGADVSVLATEMEVDVKLAERRLKEKGGDLRQALKSFM